MGGRSALAMALALLWGPELWCGASPSFGHSFEAVIKGKPLPRTSLRGPKHTGRNGPSNLERRTRSGRAGKWKRISTQLYGYMIPSFHVPYAGTRARPSVTPKTMTKKKGRNQK